MPLWRAMRADDFEAAPDFRLGSDAMRKVWRPIPWPTGPDRNNIGI